VPAPVDPQVLLARSPVAVGHVVDDKYRIDGVLGAGGMGIVLRATHLTLGQPVAIKMPLVDLAGDTEVIERLVREGRAAASLRSEHVCRVIDVGRLPSGGLPYIVMEYLEGIDASQYIKRKGALPIEDAVDFLLQVCDAVGEAHERGIIHRDLKPHNMFLVDTPAGRRKVKVLDFGISKVRDPAVDVALTTSAAFLGSPSYIAPEQMLATFAVDARADVWALGVCLYEMLTGRVPFVAASVMELAVRIANDAVVAPSVLRGDVPGGLEAVVMRCLSKSPQARYASALELGDALAHCGVALDARTTRVRSRDSLAGAVAAQPADAATVLDATLPIGTVARAAIVSNGALPGPRARTSRVAAVSAIAAVAVAISAAGLLAVRGASSRAHEAEAAPVATPPPAAEAPPPPAAAQAEPSPASPPPPSASSPSRAATASPRATKTPGGTRGAARGGARTAPPSSNAPPPAAPPAPPPPSEDELPRIR